jgi:DUF438 domain-containing protein
MSMAHEDERKRARVAQLREVIMDLHAGKTVDEVRAKFKEVIKGVTAQEISAMEQALMDEGMPVEEVQRLCDVHASVFSEALESQADPRQMPGHPLRLFVEENRAFEKLIDGEIRQALDAFRAGADNAMELVGHVNLLFDVDKHYKRKEEVLFPFLEKHGVYGPTKVMWGVDDEIRAALKDARARLMTAGGSEQDRSAAADALQKATEKVKEMIFKEEKILLPMADEHLTDDEWRQVALASPEIGYSLIEPDDAEAWIRGYAGQATGATGATDATGGTGAPAAIHLPTGVFSPEQLELMLNTLPVDITFVDENDAVRYFSASRERIFTRPRTIIGRKVHNCHPPASVHVVEGIIDSFRRGERDVAEFWIHMGPKFVYIRYFAVRDGAGNYRGTLEVSQEISGIKALEGERRLLDK